MNDARLIEFGKFVVERHAIWERRRRGEDPPFTEDPILATRKFTNAFRVLDHGSQFLLRMLAEPGLSQRNLLTRALLYRYTNDPAPWEYARAEMGHWPTWQDLDTGLLARTWQRYPGPRIFSGAYNITPQVVPREEIRGRSKLDNVIRFVTLLVHPASAAGVVDDLFSQPTLRARHLVLRAPLGLGDFMALQVLTDIGYVDPVHDENSFVALGPGSRRGLANLGLSQAPEGIAEARDYLLSLGSVPRLYCGDKQYRALSLMDVQNCLCEWSKYVKRAPGPRPYQRAHPGPLAPPVLPRHWSEKSEGDIL